VRNATLTFASRVHLFLHRGLQDSQKLYARAYASRPAFNFLHQNQTATSLQKEEPGNICGGSNALKCTAFVSTYLPMTTLRRTDEHNLRQEISEILEQTHAVEYSMGLFYRKGSLRELARAQEDIEMMRAAIERLAAIIASANQHEDAQPKVVEAAD
jgi:hypothetical protein